MRELWLKIKVRWLLLWGKRREAFCAMWVGWPGQGAKDNRCPGCGADEGHNDYWMIFDPDSLRFSSQLAGRTRNPLKPDCWRLDLTDRLDLQKTVI